MSRLRNPLLPVGLLLIVLGIGNWYTGRDKGRDHALLLESRHPAANLTDFEEFQELTARTNATLLTPTQRGGDDSVFINAKLDFYKLVQSGGRILVLVGLFCAAAGLIHSWYRQRHPERSPVGHQA